MDAIDLYETPPLALGKPVGMNLLSGLKSLGPSTPLPWVVQKFGGTSLGHFASKIVKEVILYVTCPRNRATPDPYRYQGQRHWKIEWPSSVQLSADQLKIMAQQIGKDTLFMNAGIRHIINA